jgi:low temperature requirement protein LtrA
VTGPSADGPDRVSTLELFFDLVFVFTITQLTSTLVHEPLGRGPAQVVLMFGGALTAEARRLTPRPAA